MPRQEESVRNAKEVDDGQVRVRGLEAPRPGLAQHAVVLADDAGDRQRWCARAGECRRRRAWERED